VLELLADKLLVSSVSGWNDGGRGREREREREMAETEGRGWFFANFGSNFLHDQAMKSTHIYRG
jgi:hypothetical protein